MFFSLILTKQLQTGSKLLFLCTHSNTSKNTLTLCVSKRCQIRPDMFFPQTIIHRLPSSNICARPVIMQHLFDIFLKISFFKDASALLT